MERLSGLRRRRHVRAQPSAQEVQREQGAPHEHVIPAAQVSHADCCFTRLHDPRATRDEVLPNTSLKRGHMHTESHGGALGDSDTRTTVTFKERHDRP
jgi:hypothetical protein